jgi:hypothetical protein
MSSIKKSAAGQGTRLYRAGNTERFAGGERPTSDTPLRVPRDDLRFRIELRDIQFDDIVTRIHCPS